MCVNISHMNESTTAIVYHGTTSLLDRIEVARGKPYKDFGRGFYVTKSRRHAVNIALRNRRIEEVRYGNSCEAYLYKYEIDMSGLSNFKVKEFIYADLEWLQFVIANRKVRNRTHEYDVVIGPTANDDTMVVVNAYLDGLYGAVGNDDALRILLGNIEADRLPGQIYFSSNEAAGLLIPKGKVEKL